MGAQAEPRAKNRERGERRIVEIGITVVSFRAVQYEPENGTKVRLAIGLAQGAFDCTWARAHRMSLVMVWRWARNAAHSRDFISSSFEDVPARLVLGLKAFP